VVVDGEHYSNGCCFNYGNASTNGLAVGTGTMESVYFGTSTGWGSGSGTGPWIMSDMEAGLFSGYNARVNAADPTISWRFVTGVFGGGGRNFWELKGGNAQKGGLQTFYAGVRPGSKENSAYYPMHKKGAIQMGNGGDNGNGSAGTFYEGVMTAGHPGDGVADKVQANIVAAKYDVARLTQTRLTSFTPNAVKELTASFVNTNTAAMEDVRLTVSPPAGWTARAFSPATFASHTWPSTTSAVWNTKPVSCWMRTPSGSPVTGFLMGAKPSFRPSPACRELFFPFRWKTNGTNWKGRIVENVVAITSKGIPPALPVAMAMRASRWAGVARSSK